jgi:hypothetical protein
VCISMHTFQVLQYFEFVSASASASLSSMCLVSSPSGGSGGALSGVRTTNGGGSNGSGSVRPRAMLLQPASASQQQQQRVFASGGGAVSSALINTALHGLLCAKRQDAGFFFRACLWNVLMFCSSHDQLSCKTCAVGIGLCGSGAFPSAYVCRSHTTTRQRVAREESEEEDNEEEAALNENEGADGWMWFACGSQFEPSLHVIAANLCVFNRMQQV